MINLSKITIFAETSCKDKGVFLEKKNLVKSLNDSGVLGKIKNIFNGEHRKFAWFVLVSTAVALLLWSPAFVRWIRTGIEISRQERLIEEYRKKNEELERRVDMLLNDKDTLEKFAREQFRFAAPGEDVFVISE